MRGESHVVLVNNYWIDIIPTGGYFLFSDHRDRPGLIGAVGKITGDADINISYMYVSRLKPRGQALMILALDEPLPEEQRQGAHKEGQYGYPHTLIHGEHMHIIVSRRKEAIEVMRFPLSAV